MASFTEELERLCGKVADLIERVRDLDKRMDKLEQYQCCNNIKVFRIEEKLGENTDLIVERPGRYCHLPVTSSQPVAQSWTRQRAIIICFTRA